MSAENLEVVRRANAALNAHDVEALAELLDQGFEFVDHLAAVGEEGGAGIDLIIRQFKSWIDVFPDFRAEIAELVDAGDQVISVTDWRGTGASSDLNYHVRAAEVFTVRGGKVVRAELGFADKAAALAAVGAAD